MPEVILQLLAYTGPCPPNAVLFCDMWLNCVVSGKMRLLAKLSAAFSERVLLMQQGAVPHPQRGVDY